MFPFWELVIGPVLDAIGAKRVVEIGALRGETTILMLERLGVDAELHVIDPVPEFDPSEHEEKFAGRYIFHRDLSLNVLPSLPPMDAALVDGDHNWYTVYNELTQLSDVARQADAPLPVIVMHDVCWPYGRRDLYYAPETIPEEFRQQYAKQGISIRKKNLLARGGLNPTMFNAMQEGGPRNGVMTALDDFEAAYDKPLRRLVLPIYFGLAIVVEKERLEREPELLALIERFESAEGRLELLQLSESIRLQNMVFQHNIFYRHEQMLAQAATRYLDLLKGTLLNEHYIEQEVRISYLAECANKRTKPELVKVRDPMRYMPDQRRQLLAARRAGRLNEAHDDDLAAYFPFTTMGRVRLDHLQRCLETVKQKSIAGDLVECGTGRGGGAMFLRGFLEAHEVPDVTVWVADEFRASPRKDPSADATPSTELGGGPGFPDLQGDLNSVRDGFERLGLLDDRTHFLVGPVAETLAGAPIERIALLRLGPGIGAEIEAVLDELYPKLATGGFIVVDDYASEPVRAAVERFRSRHHVEEPHERVDGSAVCWQKTAELETAVVRTTTVRRGPPLATPAPTRHTDLSVVVVFYNMRREAERTLHSLSRAYQQGIEDLDYEVIAVDNGSAPDQRLGEEFVRSFGPEFRYLDLGDNATSSPVPALNEGMAIATGDNVAFMIDGAHVLTPGVLRFGMIGLETYAPAIVATQQWYVGPGQQGDAMIGGYDQSYEDRLFDAIEWPNNGYKLFDIGHFIGDRDWFDGIWESNCMFVPRKLLEQVGAFDESFNEAGGGYSNLEFYERLGSSAGVNVATIICEGSFHQLHGGTTTNQADSDERRRRIASYGARYTDLRGREFRGPGKPIHYVGRTHPGALRTKPRHRTADIFRTANPIPDGLPDTPLPMPQELRESFIGAFWNTLSWRDTSWLGQSVEKAPTDLFAYQELIARLRPDWIVETNAESGGRAFFLATICDLLGHGQVLSVDDRSDTDRPQHPRITYMNADPIHDATVQRVHEIVGTPPNAIVILGTRAARRRMMQEFNAYSPLVPVGSYVVIETTVVNGHPVWPEFGPGPAEAVKAVMNTGGAFAPDPHLERWGLTLNPSGFLKRLR